MQYTYPATAIRVCVDEIKNGTFSGTAYSPLTETSMPFCDFAELFLVLETFFDRMAYPRAFQEKRRFFAKKETEAYVPLEEARIEARIAALKALNGKTAAFTLFVTGRQNASWQGRADWQDGSSTAFVSALELMHAVEENILRAE